MADKRNAEVASAGQRKRNSRAKAEIRPDYYRLKGGKQVIDIIELLLDSYTEIVKTPKNLSLFCLGNAVKYEMRNGLKPGALDDEKKRDTYLAMGRIDPLFWKDIARPVIQNALSEARES